MLEETRPLLSLRTVVRKIRRLLGLSASGRHHVNKRVVDPAACHSRVKAAVNQSENGARDQ